MGRLRFLIALLVLPLSAAAIVAPRYIADPYGVFHGAEETTSKRINLRVAKQRWLSKHCGEYEGYIFGNSRATGYETRMLSEVYGVDFYNMTVPTESWRGIQARTDWLIDHCDPKIFVVTLDPGATRFPFFTRDYARLEPPALSGRPAIRFYADYLRAPLSKAVNDAGTAPRGYVYEPATGHWRYPEAEAARNAGEEAFPWRGCSNQASRPYRARHYRSQDRIMRWIQRRAINADIDLVWVVHPLGAPILNQQGKEVYLKWTDAMLARTEELVFLGGYHEFAEDPLNYWDDSHFRPSATADLYRQAIEGPVSRNMVGVWTPERRNALRAKINRSYAAHIAACNAQAGREK